MKERQEFGETRLQHESHVREIERELSLANERTCRLGQELGGFAQRVAAMEQVGRGWCSCPTVRSARNRQAPAPAPRVVLRQAPALASVGLGQELAGFEQRVAAMEQVGRDLAGFEQRVVAMEQVDK